MPDPTISVIVPCYNVEKYLPLCFKCFDAQNYKNLHVIFVDDGSTDGTFVLLRDYCAVHPDYTLISGENCGVASARNKALEAIKGEFFAFHDADDIFCDNHFVMLAENMTASGADMAVCGIKRIGERKAEKFDIRYKKSAVKLQTFDKVSALEQLFSQEKFDYLLKNKLYSTEILKKSGARFLDGCRYGEESYFFYRYMSYCEKTVYYKNKTCVYVQRKGSLMHSTFNETRLDVYKNIEAVIKEIEESGKFKSVLPYVKVMRAGYSVGILHFILYSKFRDSRVIADITRTMCKDVKSLKHSPKVAFYKKMCLPVCAVIAKIVYCKHLKKEKVR